jgi:hypothetical protein
VIAFLFSEQFAPFWSNVFSFPTVVYTIALLVCTGFWFVTCLGLFDIDVLDLDVDLDVGGSGESGVNALASLLVKAGLHGVPLTVVITLLALVGWMASYFAVHFMGAMVPVGAGPVGAGPVGAGPVAAMRYLVGIPVFLGSFALAAYAAPACAAQFAYLAARSNRVCS